MKIAENKKHLFESVLEKRKKTLPKILLDGKVFSLLSERAFRLKLYAKFNELIGVRGLSNNTIKRYYLYPLDPIHGIPENNSVDEVINVMHFALTEIMMQSLVEMRSSCKAMSDNIKEIEKYIPEYEANQQ